MLENETTLVNETASVIEKASAALGDKWLKSHDLRCMTCRDLLRDIDEWLMKAYQDGQESMKPKRIHGTRRARV